MIVRNALLFLLLIFFISSAIAQPSPEECKRKLTAYVEKMSAYGIPKGKKTYAMETTVITVLRENHKSIEMRTKIILGASQMQYLSDNFSALQDANDAFTIIHPQRKIIWGRGLMKANPEKEKQLFKGTEDSLISSSKVKSCKEVDYKSRKVILIVIEPTISVKKRFKIERMEYYYDLRKEKVEQVTTYYQSTENIEKKITIYDKIDFNYKASFNKPVYNEVFSAGQKLLPKYKGYTIVDNRN